VTVREVEALQVFEVEEGYQLLSGFAGLARPTNLPGAGSYLPPDNPFQKQDISSSSSRPVLII